MKNWTPGWALHLDANVAELRDELPTPDPRQVRRFVAHLNAIMATPGRLERAMAGGRQLPAGYEHVLVTTADGGLAAMSSARRPGAVRVGDLMATLTAYGRKTFERLELLADEEHRPGVLRLLVKGGDFPLRRDAASDAHMRCATAPA